MDPVVKQQGNTVERTQSGCAYAGRMRLPSLRAELLARTMHLLRGGQLTLGSGLVGLHDTVMTAFAAVLPQGPCLPLLLRLQPRLVLPSGPGDYFAEEQVATWGLHSFCGLPEYHGTPYDRTYETPVDDKAHSFEFLVPMVAPSWNEVARTREYGRQLAVSSIPTAVAVATLDVRQPANDQGMITTSTGL